MVTRPRSEPHTQPREVSSRAAPSFAPEVERWGLPPPEPDPRVRTLRTQERKQRSQQRRWKIAFATGLQLGVLMLVAYGLVFNFSVVRGSSMTPGIADGDRIVVDHLSYVLGDVQRGDIVVLEYPLDPQYDYIKRVIGLPGDKILIRDGEVRVNGRHLDEPYVQLQDENRCLSLTVAPESFFVLGDNRPHSSDSREFGLVPRANLVGKVDLRVWPLERAGLLD
jgi:signal peptidase I